MTARLRRITRSPFVADVRAGRFDTALAALAVVGVALFVAVVLGDQHWTPTGYQPIPTEMPR